MDNETVTPAVKTPSPSSQNSRVDDKEQKVGGERKQVTVVFSDLSGFTAMSEVRDPEEVKSVISRIFGERLKLSRNTTDTSTSLSATRPRRYWPPCADARLPSVFRRSELGRSFIGRALALDTLRFHLPGDNSLRVSTRIQPAFGASSIGSGRFVSRNPYSGSVVIRDAQDARIVTKDK